MKSNRYITAAALALCASLLTVALPAFAAATLHVGAGVGSSCPIGGCFLYQNNSEVNDIAAGNTVSIYQNQQSQPVSASANKPLLLILAIPNQTTNYFSSNPISNVTFYNSYPNLATTAAGSASFAPAGKYGLSGPDPVAGDSFYGSMNSGDIYSFLTLQPPTNNSASFTNFKAAELALNNIVATSFGIHVFAIKNNATGVLAGKGLVNITFNSGALPAGTFALAYGQKGTSVFSTAFTNSGLTAGGGTPTPEPATLSLFALALTGAGFKFRRRGRSAV